MCLPPAI